MQKLFEKLAIFDVYFYLKNAVGLYSWGWSNLFSVSGILGEKLVVRVCSILGVGRLQF